MQVKLLAIVVLTVITSAEWTNTVQQGFEQADAKINRISRSMGALGRQVMLQKFYAEQRTRSDGDSGLKIVRVRRQGNKNYHSESHNGFSIASIHDHANNIRTVGMGELEAVLNGVQFRTRHNDYRLFMPSLTEKTYHKTEEIPFPDVPPSVLNEPDLNKATEEMREYFRAWRDQNMTHRNYEPYFKSVLCYLEGAWTQTDSSTLDEPFASDRHFIDARSWQELQQKNMFADYTGSKSRLENLALLPTAIMGFYNDTTPLFAQFNYRILCHPTKNLIPTSRLRAVDDLASRLMSKRDVWKYTISRQARFQVNTEDSDTFNDDRTFQTKTYLDELMEEIPGKDNYPGDLTDEGFESEVRNVDGTRKNASYYHRWFSLTQKDAMGVSLLKRGYHDNFMFAALTNHSKVAPMTIQKCAKWWDKSTCQNLTQRWTYAIPLEVIYMTPLSKWNPYDLEYKGDSRTDEGKTVTDGGRWGSCSEDAKAYVGTNSKVYYLTPGEFFSGKVITTDSADTARTGDVCVLDKNNVRKKVRASGTRIFLPEIKDVGVLRQRYPIMPIHGEGSSVWKEFSALKDLVMDPEKSHLVWGSVNNEPDYIVLSLELSMSSHVTPHHHEVRLSKSEIVQLKGGIQLERTTTEREGHTHTLLIRYRNGNYEYAKCDAQNTCWDNHPRGLGVSA